MKNSENCDPENGRYSCIFMQNEQRFCINIQPRVKVFRQFPSEPRALQAQQYGAWGSAPGTQPTDYLRAVGAKVAVGVTRQPCSVPGAWPAYVPMPMTNGSPDLALRYCCIKQAAPRPSGQAHGSLCPWPAPQGTLFTFLPFCFFTFPSPSPRSSRHGASWHAVRSGRKPQPL